MVDSKLARHRESLGGTGFGDLDLDQGARGVAGWESVGVRVEDEQRRKNMPISGLMVRVAPGESGTAGVEALRSWPEVTLGERRGDWVPLAVESRDPGHGRELHERLEGVPGVMRVEVVSVHFVDDEGDVAAEGAVGDAS